MKKNNTKENEITGIIYKLTNNITGAIYIGETKKRIEERIGMHRFNSQNEKNPNSKLYNNIRHYGWENFNWEILEYLAGSDDERKERERYWIEHYNSFEDGLNSSRGGRGLSGHRHSEITKLKIGKKHRGKTAIIDSVTAEDIKRRLTEGETMKVLSDEYSINITTVREIKLLHTWWYICPELNKKLKELTKTIIRERVDYSGIMKLDPTTREIIALYDSVTEAAKSVKAESTNISACCRGKIKTCRGYVWKYWLK